MVLMQKRTFCALLKNEKIGKTEEAYATINNETLPKEKQWAVRS